MNLPLPKYRLLGRERIFIFIDFYKFFRKTKSYTLPKESTSSYSNHDNQISVISPFSRD